MATACTDMAREMNTYVLACPSVLLIESDVNGEVIQSGCENCEPTRLCNPGHAMQAKLETVSLGPQSEPISLCP